LSSNSRVHLAEISRRFDHSDEVWIWAWNLMSSSSAQSSHPSSTNRISQLWWGFFWMTSLSKASIMIERTPSLKWTGITIPLAGSCFQATLTPLIPWLLATAHGGAAPGSRGREGLPEPYLPAIYRRRGLGSWLRPRDARPGARHPDYNDARCRRVRDTGSTSAPGAPAGGCSLWGRLPWMTGRWT